MSSSVLLLENGVSGFDKIFKEIRIPEDDSNLSTRNLLPSNFHAFSEIIVKIITAISIFFIFRIRTHHMKKVVLCCNCICSAHAHPQEGSTVL